jgi:hypothetical protein
VAIVRFSAIILLQTLPRMYNSIYYTVVSSAIANKASASALAEINKQGSNAAVVQVLCYWFNAVFVMASNRDLRASISRRWCQVFGKESNKGTTSYSSNSGSEIELVASAVVV